ncbi:adenine deaminase [Paracoccus sp. MC1862]|uniref:adenine deaminase n=1 Tax=Paracoccus sp. MC1862 TaxID=2760307 RepID=UPI0015FF3E85|nr:adenine deaminase [Paracoccus sp. MC1862]MBB1499236.1 adenine deaminase [Paracoccus sp. MC1862]QQO44867.1 adenine deaminase [Paracoccus sp. MC1862]
MLKPWIEAQARLVEVAAGRAPADTVIRGGQWVNVHTREVLPGHDIAIADGRVACVLPDASANIGPETQVIEAEGRYMVPGLIDAHMHVESGMLTPAGFAAAVIPHGTTTILHDPHEIANVMGLEGVRLMRDESLIQPITMLTQMPSCAPSAPGLETTGCPITAGEVAQAMGWDGVVGLGEMMNFPAVSAGDPAMLSEIAATRAAGKTVGGHYASPDLGRAFSAYVAGGAADDHETVAEAQAVARVRQGMGAMLRLGSAWHDVQAQITAITQRGLDPSGFMLCTDDSHAGTLVHDGHMDRVVRHAVDCGCDPLVAIQMATINTARHFGLERELGSITPGRRADVMLTSDLRALPVEMVVAQGRLVAEDGRLLVDCPLIDWPDAARNSVHLGRALTAADFRVPAEGTEADVRVIGVIENQAPTRALTATLPVRDGEVIPEGVERIALVERHKGTGGVVNGFVQGFGYRGRMAVASTIAHDSHHMIVVGTCGANMAAASARLAELGGGVTVFRDGAELAHVALPIAGLMSERPAAEVAEAVEAINHAIRDCGCTLNNAIMQHVLLALVVIPELRISDLGLVAVTRFQIGDVVTASR